MCVMCIMNYLLPHRNVSIHTEMSKSVFRLIKNKLKWHVELKQLLFCQFDETHNPDEEQQYRHTCLLQGQNKTWAGSEKGSLRGSASKLRSIWLLWLQKGFWFYRSLWAVSCPVSGSSYSFWFIKKKKKVHSENISKWRVCVVKPHIHWLTSGQLQVLFFCFFKVKVMKRLISRL